MKPIKSVHACIDIVADTKPSPNPLPRTSGELLDRSLIQRLFERRVGQWQDVPGPTPANVVD
eukprot:7772246-Pyramimonas_sp.AAC.1